MRRKKSISKIGEKIESILNRKEIELIAKEVGFVSRKSNLMGSDFLYLNIQRYLYLLKLYEIFFIR